jgi:uncharacterized protein YukE
MTSVEVPNSKPEPFPESDADVIREQASYLDTLGDVAAVTAAIQLLPLLGPGSVVVAGQGDSWAAAMEAFFEYVKPILGDYTKVRDLALEWADVSNVPMDIREDLRDMMGVVSGYWQGAAFVAFQTHIEALNETFKDTTGKMIEVARTLANAITLIFDTWSSAIAFIAKCAMSIGGMWDPTSICEGLTAMAKDTVDLIEKAGKTMGQYVKDLAQIDITATGFRPLPNDDDSLASAGNEDGWEVKPAPGS